MKSNIMIKPLMALRSVRRPTTMVIAAFGIACLLVSLLSSSVREQGARLIERPWATDTGDTSLAFDSGSATSKGDKRKLHVLLPATQSNIDFCKTILTMTLLGYPNPSIVGWGEDDEGSNLLGGGSHFLKITRVLDYINDEERRKQPGFEDDLLFMLDSYDIWFQLPPEVLVSRYDTIVAEENARVAHALGRAHSIEGIKSPIVFGGGKRCSPNHLYTVACYAIPESPLPADTHKGNTDTTIGRNSWASFRTRYLNSGYMIGPVKDMRPMLEKAKERLAECIERTGAYFDGEHGVSNFCYHGSDQSIFVEMFGQQSFHREVMRRHHRNFFDDLLDKFIPGRAGGKPPMTDSFGARITDRLNPAFDHEQFDPTYLPNKPYEWGIAIDYWSTLGHQTSNADFDYRFVRHDQPLEPQVGEQGPFDCIAKAPMPTDLPQGQIELLKEGPDRWDTIPLFTEICVGVAPVMIHHNSIDKSHRERQWDKTWWYKRSRPLLALRKEQKAPQLTLGIPTDKGTTMSWDELCPADVEEELFRDEPKP